MGKIKIILAVVVIYFIYKGFTAIKDFDLALTSKVQKIEDIAGVEKENGLNTRKMILVKDINNDTIKNKILKFKLEQNLEVDIFKLFDNIEYGQKRNELYNSFIQGSFIRYQT